LKGGLYHGNLAYVPVSDGQTTWTIPTYIGNGTDYQIKIVIDGTTPPVEDVSNGPFEISGSSPPPTVSITSPNGGEQWLAGTTHTVTWTASNPVGEVGIYLDKGGVIQTGIDYVSMAAGSTDWSIPAFVGDGSDYTIRILFTDNGAYTEDSSDAPFQISGSATFPTLTVTSPNGGETWTAGNTHVVTWTSTNTIGDVSVNLLKAENFLATIGFAPMSTGSVEWAVPSWIGDGEDYTVSVSWYGEGGGFVEDTSDAPFSITGSAPPPTITVTSPNGGEIWQAGTTCSITWTSMNPTGYANIILEQGGVYYDQIGMAELAAGAFEWNIPPYIGDSTDYTVLISWDPGSGNPVEDRSDAPFEITGSLPLPTITVTRPNGGEVWTAGTTQRISWTSTDPADNVSIQLYKSGIYYDFIGSAPMSDGQFDWSIPATVGDGTDYTVVISWAGSGGWTEDASDAPFEMTGSQPLPSITVISPNGGELWQAGTITRTVTWSSTNATGQVDAVLNKGGVFHAYIGSALMSTGTLDWTIPPYIQDGDDYEVVISWQNGSPMVSDTSDAPFTIVAFPPLPQDMDQDGDVDRDDYNLFAACLSGSAIPQTEPPCAKARFDADDDVDQEDFGLFQRCLSGPSQAPPRNCAE